jgi:ADP-heptose:LPS heptosyltransferase
LRRNRYDVVIDGRIAINNVNKHTTILMLATGAPWRIGIGGRTNDRVYSVPVRAPHLGHWVDNIVALASPFGVKPTDRDWRARLPFTDQQRADGEALWQRVGSGRPRILVNLYSAMADRLWPVENFGPVLARFRQRLPDATVVIPTMPSGDPVAERLVQPVNGAALPLDLDQLTALTATADLVVSPDTAVTVIASAFHVPVLALMRKDTHRWVPYRVPGLTVFSADPRSLNQLPVERVLAGVDQVIDTVGRERGWVLPERHQ